MRENLKTSTGEFLSDEGIARRIENKNELTGKKPNLIVITVESLSSDFCGAFGAENSFTPELDALAPKCFLFTKMLAK